jgi:uncharacterized RDD family membrane protein YckC
MENPNNGFFGDDREGATGVSKKKSGPNYHPWRRFYARTIDLFFISFVVVALVGSAFSIFLPHMVNAIMRTFKNPFLSGVIVYIFWVPVEAFFLSRVGATPGKSLFGIQVLDKSGHRLSYADAMQRTFLLWIKGEGLGFPLVAIVTRLFAYKRLKNTGTTLWDSAMGTVVTHKEFTALRTIACVIVVGTVAFVTLVLTLAGNI